MTAEPKLPRTTAEELNHDTARKEAIERRKEGKDPAAGVATPGWRGHKETKRKASKAKKEAEKKQQEPGAPLQLTR